MPLTNPFSITYADQEVGGGTSYQLTNPYVIEKTHDTLSLSFEVLIAGGSFGGLQSDCETLEDAFRKRLVKDETLVIDIGGSQWTYTEGTDILNTTASIAKSGSVETDRGLSRAYICSISAELPPAADSTTLRDIEVQVTSDAAKKRTITLQGVYTAKSGSDAYENYSSSIDDEAQVYIDAVLDGASGSAFELVDENFSFDRQKNADGNALFTHLCLFRRQYTEVFFNQTIAALDDQSIADHRVVFTDLSQHPGDSDQSTYRMRRVVADYDCAVDQLTTKDLQDVYNNKVVDHVRQLFIANFNPQVYCVTDARFSTEKTANRLSVSIQFLYQSPDGDSIVEVSQSLSYREARQVDMTPVHEQSELSYEVDPGWTVLERITTRNVIAIGDLKPRTILTSIASGSGSGGAIPSGAFRQSGWIPTTATSSASPVWIGDPKFQQIRTTSLAETVIERYAQKPGGRAGGPTTGGSAPGPVTPGGGGFPGGGGGGGGGGAPITPGGGGFPG